MTKQRQMWVSPNKAEKDWTAGKAGSERVRHFERKDEARDYARDVSINQGLEMVVQKKNGTIGEKNTYFTPDRFPPKG